MTATITNHTNPGQTPVQGDLVTTESEGMSVTKEYFPPLDNTPSETELARFWRDEELTETDKASQTPDWPNRDNIITYRAALRDWPSTADFPDTKPTLGS
tara:strand:- start:15 stop:314 length:300 start_codon:yes stop_codon:yes gene_type:complete